MNSTRKTVATYVLAFSLLLSACGPGQLFGPALTPTPTLTLTPTSTLTPTPTLTSTSTPIPTSTFTPTPLPVITDGEWTGQDSNNNLISFTVKDQNISSFILQTITSPNCAIGYDSNEALTQTLIANGKFSLITRVLFAPNDNLLMGLKFGDLVIGGTFTAENKANGTVKITDKDCGINMTWTAEKK